MSTETAAACRVVLGRTLGDAPADRPRDVGVTVRAGRIEILEPTHDARRRACAEGWPLVDLGTRVLVPGFVDAHSHQQSAARDRLVARTSHVGDIAGVVEAVRVAAADTAEGAWITTERSLSRGQLVERRFPDRHELDAATTRHPVAVRFGAHAMALNSQALARAGLDGAVDPDGGWLERGVDGSPLGPIHEYGAIRRVEREQRPPTASELVDALAATQREFVRQGVTSVRVPGVRPGELELFQRLRRRGQLRTRVTACVRVDPNLSADDKVELIGSWPVTSGFGDDWLAVGALKIFVDGGVDAADDDAHTYFLEADELRGLCVAAGRRGWGVTCHAVTARAVDLVLRAYLSTRRQRGGAERSIEHGLFATGAQLATMAHEDVWLSTQPGLRELNGHLLEGRRARGFCPVRSAVDAGVRVALGSDWNATPGTGSRPYSPRRTLAYAVDHGAESIPASLALRLHTAAAGELVGVPGLGTLAPGAPADLVAYEDVEVAADLVDARGEAPTDVLVGGDVMVRDREVVPHAGKDEEDT